MKKTVSVFIISPERFFYVESAVGCYPAISKMSSWAVKIRRNMVSGYTVE